MHTKVVYLIALILLSYAASAATIQGTVYSFDLEPASGVIVTINTTPLQRMVVVNGTYQFTVPLGSYMLISTNQADDSSIEERIEVIQEGSFTLDLILFPNLDLGEDILRDLDEIEIEGSDEPTAYPWLLGILILAVLLAGWGVVKLFLLQRKGDAAPITTGENEEVLHFIKKEGGRTTQKDIRKHFPLSEAKISLIIADLESQGKIKKIKKGRGNIIILL